MTKISYAELNVQQKETLILLRDLIEQIYALLRHELYLYELEETLTILESDLSPQAFAIIYAAAPEECEKIFKIYQVEQANTGIFTPLLQPFAQLYQAATAKEEQYYDFDSHETLAIAGLFTTKSLKHNYTLENITDYLAYCLGYTNKYDKIQHIRDDILDFRTPNSDFTQNCFSLYSKYLGGKYPDYNLDEFCFYCEQFFINLKHYVQIAEMLNDIYNVDAQEPCSKFDAGDVWNFFENISYDTVLAMYQLDKELTLCLSLLTDYLPEAKNFTELISDICLYETQLEYSPPLVLPAIGEAPLTN